MHAVPLISPPTKVLSLHQCQLAGDLAADIQAHAISDPSRLQLALLGRRFGCCTRNIQKFFRDRYGVSVHQYIIQIRHQYVLRQLAREPIPIKTIAVELGYKDVSNFSRDFARLQGMSPSEYRLFLAARRTSVIHPLTSFADQYSWEAFGQ